MCSTPTNDQNKMPKKFLKVVAVIALTVVAIIVARFQLAALATSGKVKCRYIGQGTNSAGVVVSQFDVTGLDGKYFTIPYAVVFNNQGVISTNTLRTLGVTSIGGHSVTPDRFIFGLPFTAPTNTWQLQLLVSRESLLARVAATLETGKLLPRAHGWPYEHWILSTEALPQSP